MLARGAWRREISSIFVRVPQMVFVPFVACGRIRTIFSSLVLLQNFYGVVSVKFWRFSGTPNLLIIFGPCFFRLIINLGSLCGFYLQPKAGPFGTFATNFLLKLCFLTKLLTVSLKLVSSFRCGALSPSQRTWSLLTRWSRSCNASTVWLILHLPQLGRLLVHRSSPAGRGLSLANFSSLWFSVNLCHLGPWPCILSLWSVNGSLVGVLWTSQALLI